MPLWKLVLPALVVMAMFGLLMRQSRLVQPVRRIVGTMGLVAFITAIFFLAAVAFLAILEGHFGPRFGDDREFVNMSYEEYASTVGIAGFDPKGASEICFRSHSTRDSYDVWLKLRLPSASYNSLLAKMSADMEDPQFVSSKEDIPIPVKKTISKSSNCPGNWPGPEVNPPGWFEPAQIGHQVQCIQWDVQLLDRSKGWYWLYDLDSETLRIWEWNRQHWKVR
jgi:hypothetical protein